MISRDIRGFHVAVFWWFFEWFSVGFLGRFLKPATNVTPGFPKNEDGFLRCERSSGAAFTSLFGRFLPRPSGLSSFNYVIITVITKIRT